MYRFGNAVMGLKAYLKHLRMGDRIDKVEMAYLL